jgi:hypothetical protein
MEHFRQTARHAGRRRGDPHQLEIGYQSSQIGTPVTVKRSVKFVVIGALETSDKSMPV